VLCSHLGRPKGEVKPELSLKPVAEHLMNLLEAPAAVQFNSSMDFDDYRDAVAHLDAGEILLIENLRFHPEEKKGDEAFAKELASLADVYVNDAFGTAHRAHASTAVVARHFDEKYPGLLMQQELDNGQHILESPGKPFVLISGGAKVSDKLAILENLMDKVDTILIGGGMAYTFIHAQGGQIGNSLLEKEHIDTARRLLKLASEKNTRLVLPEDSVVASEFKETAEHKITPSDAIPDGWMGLDIGPKAREQYNVILQEAKTVLWNGPMGVFEWDNFAEGTLGMAKALAETTRTGAYTLIGGGDSAAAVRKAGVADEVSYVSTGGGALLELLEGKTLPGLAALQD
ncbi:MAG: phosphoglycerate kinase, partial [Bacteroidota bacterium]